MGVDCRCGEEGLGMARVAMGSPAVVAVPTVRGDLEGKIGAERKLSSCPKGLWDLKLDGGVWMGPRRPGCIFSVGHILCSWFPVAFLSLVLPCGRSS